MMTPVENGSTCSGVTSRCSAKVTQVARARAKRRLREVFRLHQTLVPPGLDLMLVARAAVNRWAFPELAEKFSTACQKMSATAQV